jgi:peptidoglycan/xylan/chitin deacetylase (PgdA/CDA1 family)
MATLTTLSERQSLMFARGVQIASLAYHDVTDDAASSGFQRRGARHYRVGVQDFLRQLDAMSGLAQAPRRVTHIDWSQPGRHLLLTFDDGGRSALDTGAELCRRGWRGHFFVTTARIGERTFLDAAGVRELRRCGHVVGSHSHTHPDIFRELGFAAMLDEWRVSRDVLCQLLGDDVTAASVPGGDVSRNVLCSAARVGYRYVFTSEPRLAPQRIDDCWVLGRAVVKHGASLQHVRELAGCDGWTRERVKRAVKNAARRGFPVLYRRYVRALAVE